MENGNDLSAITDEEEPVRTPGPNPQPTNAPNPAPTPGPAPRPARLALVSLADAPDRSPPTLASRTHNWSLRPNRHRYCLVIGLKAAEIEGGVRFEAAKFEREAVPGVAGCC